MTAFVLLLFFYVREKVYVKQGGCLTREKRWMRVKRMCMCVMTVELVELLLTALIGRA